MITSYETQVFDKNRWKINSISDDRETAVYDAQRLAGGSRYQAIRVVEELAEKGSESSRIRVVFRSGKAPVQTPPPPADRSSPASASPAGSPASGGGGAGAPDQAALDAVFANMGQGGGAPTGRHRPGAAPVKARKKSSAGGQKRRKKKQGIGTGALIAIILGTILGTGGIMFAILQMLAR